MAASLKSKWEALYTGEKMPDHPSAPNLLALFQRALVNSSDKPAVLYFDKSVTYGELDRMSESLAFTLAGRGVVKGDRIGLCLQNTPSFLIGALAAWKLGGIVVPISPMSRPAELRKILPDCLPKAILVHDELVSYFRETISGIHDYSPDIILCSAHELSPSVDVRVMPKEIPIVPAEGELLMRDAVQQSDASILPVSLHKNDTAMLVYTSGTTGVPKGVIVAHDMVCWNSLSIQSWVRFKTGDGPVLGVAPLFHITGITGGIALSWQMAEPLVLTYRFHPETVLEALKYHRPSFCVATITAYNALMSSKNSTRDHYASFKSMLSGGAPVPPSLAEDFFSHSGVRLHNAYGLTETCGGVTTVPLGLDAPVDKGSGALSVGIPTYGAELWIAGDNDMALPPGEIGEIAVRGRAVSHGYWNKPKVSAEFMREDGFRTGDVGFMDE